MEKYERGGTVTVQTGWKYTCDRADCGAHVEMVTRADQVRGELLRLGWGWSHRGPVQHFCPNHKAPGDIPERTVSDEKRHLRAV